MLISTASEPLLNAGQNGFNRGRSWYEQNIYEIIVFWTLPRVLLLFKTQRFGDWILSPPSRGTDSVSKTLCSK
jgi:hypothetical protein